uniref:Uncharacterized protein n=1 Tax=Planktothrix pseudagardhii TaxID=132604 RepID=A0A9W4CLC8_9CYAN|nr:hypothetical protein NO713_02841 [Planktothrix pseudagardhii]
MDYRYNNLGFNQGLFVHSLFPGRTRERGVEAYEINYAIAAGILPSYLT